MKKISIITVNYNNAIGLQKTIKSVVSQSYQDFEFIVVDGGSTDNSNTIIKLETRINYYISEKDNGIYNAQNKGISKATGQYLLFLNSGDCLVNNDTLKNCLSTLNTNDVIYGDLIIQTSGGKQTYLNSPQKLDVYHFMISTLWHPCAFIKKELFLKVGSYNEEFKITADYEFFIRAILKNGASTKYINLPITVFDLGGISNNPHNESLHKAERAKSWKLNFTPTLIQTFEDYTKLVRSSEYKLGKKLIDFKKKIYKK